MDLDNQLVNCRECIHYKQGVMILIVSNFVKGCRITRKPERKDLLCSQYATEYIEKEK